MHATGAGSGALLRPVACVMPPEAFPPAGALYLRNHNVLSGCCGDTRGTTPGGHRPWNRTHRRATSRRRGF